MKIVKFKEHNTVFAANQPEYLPLPAYKVPGDEAGAIIFKWQLSFWERVKLLFTGTVWHRVLTFNQPLQPLMLDTRSPFVKASAVVAAILCFGLTAFGQINASNVVAQVTTNATQQTALDNAINALGLNITNYSIDPYATYAPSAPAGSSKFGGGILALYDFSQNASAGIGMDWLGQFSLVSGNLELKAPFHLATIFPSLTSASWYQSLTITPFVLGGVGTPYSGDGHFNGSAMVISDVGGAIEFGHLFGGRFDAGAAWGRWTGSGPYGGVTRYHAFFGFTKGF